MTSNIPTHCHVQSSTFLPLFFPAALLPPESDTSSEEGGEGGTGVGVSSSVGNSSRPPAGGEGDRAGGKGE